MTNSKNIAKKPTILVIEDESLLLQAITKKMQLSDFEVVGATSAQQGIDYLNELPKLPDIIWLDYYLKDMTGLDFVKEIKKNTEWADLPVVVVSNSASQDKVETMLALGVERYILKASQRLEDIVQVVRDLIQKEEQERSHE